MASADSTCARRAATGPSSGAERRWAISLPAWRSASSASSRSRDAARAARSASSRAASAAWTRLGGGLDLGERGLLGLRRGLDLRDERLAPVALGEHAVLPAGRDLAQLARARRPDAAVARDGDAAEAGRERGEVVDDPDAAQQRGGEPCRRAVAGDPDVVGERLGAGRRAAAPRHARRGRRPRPRRRPRWARPARPRRRGPRGRGAAPPRRDPRPPRRAGACPSAAASACS